MMWKRNARLLFIVLGAVVTASCATIDSFVNSVSASMQNSFAQQATTDNQATTARPVTLTSRPTSLPAGSRDFSRYRDRGVEPRVANTPASLENFTGSPEGSLSRLVNYLVKNEPDPILRLKNIHDWIATHIAYDAQSFFSGSVPAQSWNRTLETGRAVCQGYAELFSEMMTMAGFQNRIVTGYSRGYGYNPLTGELIHSNHAWNAVLLSDGWHLLDVTWDSGYVDGRSFHRRYSTSYFLLPPDKMIYSHFPDDAAWQLLPHPMTADVFLSTPRLDGDFFSFGITNYAKLKRSYTVSGEGKIHLNYGEATARTGGQGTSASKESGSATHLYVDAVVRTPNGKETKGATFVESVPGSITILLRPHTTGSLLLDLYASKRPDAQIYEQIWSTQLMVTSKANNGFPYVYQTYSSHGAKLESPFESPLPVGSVQEFRIVVPGARKVAVVAGNSWVMLSRDAAAPNLFHGRFTVPSVNEFDIVANFGQSNQYAGLVKFAVQ